jgi:hypothetical protein
MATNKLFLYNAFRSKRDQFEQEAFEAAGVPLIRIANSDAAEIEKVLAVLRGPSNT